MPELDIIACATGKEALTAVKRYEFEIITTGISLDDMDGYKVIEGIRESPKNRETAVFVVSGDTDTTITTDDGNDSTAVTAYFDKAEGHKALVNFIINFLGSNNTQPIKILYVDKSATSTAITSSILARNDIAFEHFREAEKALDCLHEDIAVNTQCSFDMMITDLMLSQQMSGFDMIQTIRNELKLDYLALPILLMTIEPGEDEKNRFHWDFWGRNQ